jgi:NAD(P)-dependent dehydrogenase (short-subunit alcohol dehydrogenase family)
MQAAADALRDRVAGVERRPPRIPILSNVTGTWLRDEEAVDPSYWGRQLRATVRFGDAVAELLRDERRVALEVGPGRTLAALLRAHPAHRSSQPVISSLPLPRDGRTETEAVLEALGRLWVAGAEVDWVSFRGGETRRRVHLPTYPFERQRYWIDVPRAEPPTAPRFPVATGKRADLADWFYRPAWRSSVPPLDGPGREGGSCWLVFVDECGLGARLVERLRRRERRVITVEPRPRFERRQKSAFGIRPGVAADYERLLSELRAEGAAPDRIAHLWGVTPREGPGPSLEPSQDLGFYSLVFLAQALGSQSADGEVALTVVTSGMQEVSGEGLLYAEKATVLGPCRVIPQEYPTVSCRSVDVVAPESGAWRDEEIGWLLAECSAREGDPVVAYRGRERWVQGFEAVRLEDREPRAARLRDRGVYLITGGLGGIGLEIAEFLLDSVKARLVLVGRSGMPAREEWAAWVDREGETHATSRRIRKVQALEARGGEVLLLQADVSDRRQMEEVLARAEARFREVNGVIHAAGVAPGGVIQLKTREMAARVLAPKVAGTLVLGALLRDRRPDFVVLCSSLASVLGIPGQSDYCAANAFQDAFARRCAGAGGPFVLSLNWDTWSETGMAASEAATPTGILSSEGKEAFARALAQPLAQLMVSTVDLAPRLAQHRALGKASSVDAAAVAPTRYRRPELAVSYAAPRDELEQAIVEVWQELVGFEPVGIHDDFFDLGGHSLLAMQMINRLRQTYRVPLRLQALFEAPTVAGLARTIVASEPRSGQAHEIARLARKIESLSDEEVEALLQADGTMEGHAP